MPSRLRTRALAAAAAATVAAVAVAGCGEDADPVERDRFTGAAATSPAERPGDAPGTGVTTLTAVEGRLGAAGLNLVRTGGRELGPEAGVPFLAHTRYEDRTTGLEFDVWVLGDVAAARAATANLRDSTVVAQGGRVARGGNVVAAYAQTVRDTPVARVLAATLGRLRCDPPA